MKFSVKGFFSKCDQIRRKLTLNAKPLLCSGSILGPIIFNIVLSDLLLIVTDSKFASYADGNTISQK